MEIIRGTTPTLIFTFSQITPDNLAVAYLLIKQGNSTIIEKELSDGIIEDGALSFTLAQEDTLKLSTSCNAQIVLDWKTTGNVRGRSRIYDSAVRVAGKDETI